MGKLEEARALSAMKESDGWNIMNKWIEDTKDIAFNNMMSPSKSSKWEDFVHYRATYNAYSKLLTILEQKIKQGIEENKDERS